MDIKQQPVDDMTGCCFFNVYYISDGFAKKATAMAPGPTWVPMVLPIQ